MDISVTIEDNYRVSTDSWRGLSGSMSLLGVAGGTCQTEVYLHSQRPPEGP